MGLFRRRDKSKSHSIVFASKEEGDRYKQRLADAGLTFVSIEERRVEPTKRCAVTIQRRQKSTCAMYRHSCKPIEFVLSRRGTDLDDSGRHQLAHRAQRVEVTEPESIPELLH